jgi:copper chaperone CopZ
MLVEMNLTRVAGVEKAKVDYAHEKAEVTFDDAVADERALVAAVDDAGYEGSVAG